jgi:L-iditol 2-dehydrogenase
MRKKVFQGLAFECSGPNQFSVAAKEWTYLENPSSVLIKTTHVGLCSSDYKRLFSHSNRKETLILGHEVVGEVAAAFTGSSIEIGDKVAIYPLLPCRNCLSCSINQFNLCINYSYFGSRIDGGLQSFLEVPIWNIYRFSSNLPLDLMVHMEPFSVVAHSFSQLERRNLEDAKLLILGSGFLAYAAVLIARFLGIRNIDILSKSNRNSEIFQREEIELNKKLLGNSYDFCIDYSGNGETSLQATYLLKPGAKLIIVANTHERTFFSRESIENILRKELKVIGSWNSSAHLNNSDWVLAEAILKNKNNLDYPITNLLLRDLHKQITLKAEREEFQKSRIVVNCEG